jgi:hypothetical protein
MDTYKLFIEATDYNIDTLRQVFEELHDCTEVGLEKLPKYCSEWHKVGNEIVERRPVLLDLNLTLQVQVKHVYIPGRGREYELTIEVERNDD